MNKQRYLSESGSITIMAAILISSISAMALGLGIYAEILSEQMALNRHVDLLSENVLASYDRTLYERYGLLAFTSEAYLDDFQSYNFIDYESLAEMELEYEANLYEPEGLLNQIRKFTDIRLPGIIVEELLDRSEAFSNLLDRIPNLPVLDILGDKDISSLANIFGAQEERKTISVAFDSVQMDLPNQTDDSDEEVEVVEEVEEGMTEGGVDEVDEIDHELIDDFATSLDSLELINGSLNFNDLDISESYGDNIFSPFLYLIDTSNEFLNSIDFHALDKIVFTEYVLNIFQSRMRGPDSDINPEFISLSGQNMSKYSYSSIYEAEKILTARANENTANSLVQIFIYSIRLLSNYISNLNNTSLMSAYRTTAGLLSTSIALISLGSVVIEPETLAQVMLIADSGIDAWSDLSKLKNGESIVFYKTNSASFIDDIELAYLDYLRLISLITPLEKSLEQVAEVINDNMNDDYYISASLRFIYQNPLWTKTGVRSIKYE